MAKKKKSSSHNLPAVVHPAVASDRSPVIMTELVLPSHTNALNTIFGGVVMGWIDIAGAIAAQRYCRNPVVTVSIDHLHFIVPIKIGYTVRITARVTYAGRTSMETEVLVDAENAITGEVRRATKAYLTYVAIDAQGRPKQVPSFSVSGAAEKKAFAEAEVRRKRRLAWLGE
ncbi:acyl-CoA thioesterase [bacterium]|nr:acyl-CoA thioesterase [bacterium]